MEEENNYHCDTCDIKYATLVDLLEHRWSLIHHIKLDQRGKKTQSLHCKLCMLRCVDLVTFTQHVNGKRHKRALTKFRDSELYRRSSGQPAAEKPQRTHKHFDGEEEATEPHGNAQDNQEIKEPEHMQRKKAPRYMIKKSRHREKSNSRDRSSRGSKTKQQDHQAGNDRGHGDVDRRYGDRPDDGSARRSGGAGGDMDRPEEPDHEDSDGSNEGDFADDAIWQRDVDLPHRQGYQGPLTQHDQFQGNRAWQWGGPDSFHGNWQAPVPPLMGVNSNWAWPPPQQGPFPGGFRGGPAFGPRYGWDMSAMAYQQRHPLVSPSGDAFQQRLPWMSPHGGNMPGNSSAGPTNREGDGLDDSTEKDQNTEEETDEREMSPKRKDTLNLSLKASKIIDDILNKTTKVAQSPEKSKTLKNSEERDNVHTGKPVRGPELLSKAKKLCEDIRAKRASTQKDQGYSRERKDSCGQSPGLGSRERKDSCGQSPDRGHFQDPHPHSPHSRRAAGHTASRKSSEQGSWHGSNERLEGQQSGWHGNSERPMMQGRWQGNWSNAGNHQHNWPGNVFHPPNTYSNQFNLPGYGANFQQGSNRYMPHARDAYHWDRPELQQGRTEVEALRSGKDMKQQQPKKHNTKGKDSQFKKPSQENPRDKTCQEKPPAVASSGKTTDPSLSGSKQHPNSNILKVIRKRLSRQPGDGLMKESLMKLVNSPRSRKERLQVAKMLHRHSRSQRLTARPKLNLQNSMEAGSGEDTADESQYTLNLEDLPAEVKEQIMQLIDDEMSGQDGEEESSDVEVITVDGDNNPQVLILEDFESSATESDTLLSPVNLMSPGIPEPCVTHQRSVSGPTSTQSGSCNTGTVIPSQSQQAPVASTCPNSSATKEDMGCIPSETASTTANQAAGVEAFQSFLQSALHPETAAQIPLEMLNTIKDEICDLPDIKPPVPHQRRSPHWQTEMPDEIGPSKSPKPRGHTAEGSKQISPPKVRVPHRDTASGNSAGTEHTVDSRTSADQHTPCQTEEEQEVVPVHEDDLKWETQISTSSSHSEASLPPGLPIDDDIAGNVVKEVGNVQSLSPGAKEKEEVEFVAAAGTSSQAPTEHGNKRRREGPTEIQDVSGTPASPSKERAKRIKIETGEDVPAEVGITSESGPVEETLPTPKEESSETMDIDSNGPAVSVASRHSVTTNWLNSNMVFPATSESCVDQVLAISLEEEELRQKLQTAQQAIDRLEGLLKRTQEQLQSRLKMKEKLLKQEDDLRNRRILILKGAVAERQSITPKSSTADSPRRLSDVANLADLSHLEGSQATAEWDNSSTCTAFSSVSARQKKDGMSSITAETSSAPLIDLVSMKSEPPSPEKEDDCCIVSEPDTTSLLELPGLRPDKPTLPQDTQPAHGRTPQSPAKQRNVISDKQHSVVKQSLVTSLSPAKNVPTSPYKPSTTTASVEQSGDTVKSFPEKVRAAKEENQQYSVKLLDSGEPSVSSAASEQSTDAGGKSPSTSRSPAGKTKWTPTILRRGRLKQPDNDAGQTDPASSCQGAAEVKPETMEPPVLHPEKQPPVSEAPGVPTLEGKILTSDQRKLPPVEPGVVGRQVDQSKLPASEACRVGRQADQSKQPASETRGVGRHTDQGKQPTSETHGISRHIDQGKQSASETRGVGRKADQSMQPASKSNAVVKQIQPPKCGTWEPGEVQKTSTDAPPLKPWQVSSPSASVAPNSPIPSQVPKSPIPSRVKSHSFCLGDSAPVLKQSLSQIPNSEDNSGVKAKYVCSLPLGQAPSSGFLQKLAKNFTTGKKASYMLVTEDELMEQSGSESDTRVVSKKKSSAAARHNTKVLQRKRMKGKRPKDSPKISKRSTKSAADKSLTASSSRNTPCSSQDDADIKQTGKSKCGIKESFQKPKRGVKKMIRKSTRKLRKNRSRNSTDTESVTEDSDRVSINTNSQTSIGPSRNLSKREKSTPQQQRKSLRVLRKKVLPDHMPNQDTVAAITSGTEQEKKPNKSSEGKIQAERYCSTQETSAREFPGYMEDRAKSKVLANKIPPLDKAPVEKNPVIKDDTRQSRRKKSLRNSPSPGPDLERKEGKRSVRTRKTSEKLDNYEEDQSQRAPNPHVAEEEKRQRRRTKPRKILSPDSDSDDEIPLAMRLQAKFKAPNPASKIIQEYLHAESSTDVELEGLGPGHSVEVPILSSGSPLPDIPHLPDPPTHMTPPSSPERRTKKRVDEPPQASSSGMAMSDMTKGKSPVKRPALNRDQSLEMDMAVSSTTGPLPSDSMEVPGECPSAAELFREAAHKGKLNIRDSNNQMTSGTFQGHTASIHCLVIWENWMITGSEDHTVRRFDLKSHECVSVYKSHTKGVQCLLATSTGAQGTQIYSGSFDNSVACHDLESGELLTKTLFAHRVHCFHESWECLYVGLGNGNVICMDLKSHKLLDTFKCSDSPIRCVTTAKEGTRKLLCVASTDCSITIRDARSSLLIRTLEGHTKTPMTIKVVNHLLFSGAADRTVQVHNINTGDLERCLNHKGVITSIGIRDNHLLAAGYEGIIKVYNTKSWSLEQVYYGAGASTVTAMEIHQNMLYTGNREGLVEGIVMDLEARFSCKFGSCSMVFGRQDHLEHHVVHDHVLPNSHISKCLWGRSCPEYLPGKEDVQSTTKHVIMHILDDYCPSDS